MSDREIKTIKTTEGHEVVLKTYLTGKETNKLRDIIYSRLNIDTDSGQSGQSTKLPGSIILEQEIAALEVCVISLDGKTEGVSDAVQDLKAAEYQEIVNAVNEVTKDLFPQPKQS